MANSAVYSAEKPASPRIWAKTSKAKAPQVGGAPKPEAQDFSSLLPSSGLCPPFLIQPHLLLIPPRAADPACSTASTSSLSAPSTSLLSLPQNPSPGRNMHHAAWGFSLNTGVPLSAAMSAVMDIKAVVQIYVHSCEHGHILQGIVSPESVQKREIWDCLLLIFLIFTPTHAEDTSTGNNNWKYIPDEV